MKRAEDDTWKAQCAIWPRLLQKGNGNGLRHRLVGYSKDVVLRSNDERRICRNCTRRRLARPVSPGAGRLRGAHAGCRLRDNRRTDPGDGAAGVGDKIFRAGDRRGKRRHAVPGKCDGDALSGVVDQDDDALSAVRGPRPGTRVEDDGDSGVLLRGAATAVEDGPQDRPVHRRRKRHPRADGEVGQRLRGGGCRVSRRHGRAVRPADDGSGAPTRHDGHGVPQRVRSARSGSAHDRARHGGARHGATLSLSAALSLFLAARLHLSVDVWCAATTI